MPSRKINLPNVITITRILLIPVFLYFLARGYNGYALAAFAAACLTDAADGAAARLSHARSELGALLDPVADKMLSVSAFALLTMLGRMPLWLTLTVVLRELVVVTGGAALYLRGHDFRIRPSLMGKAATFLQFTLLAASLLGMYLGRGLMVTGYLAWTAFAFTAASGLQYVLIGIKMVNRNTGSGAGGGDE